MKDKVTKTVSDVVTNTKRVVHNGEKFVQAVALLVVAGFSYYAQSRVNISEPAQLVVIVALVIIGLRGAYEFISFLNKDEQKKGK